MKKIMQIFAICASGALLPLAPGCNNAKVDGQKAQKEHKQILSDSITAIETEIDSCKNNIATLNDRINQYLPDFVTVANPREVGSYVIYNKMKPLYPLKSTGLAARISDTGTFELIAALKSGEFDQISIVTGDKSVTSGVVPHDQALNYRDGNLTTVAFSGEKADEIGEFISDNMLNNLRVCYLQQGRLIVSWRMPMQFNEMIGATYLLYYSQAEVERISRHEELLHQKINILRSHRDSRPVTPASTDSAAAK